jgi:hypothetical protein
MVQMSPVDTGRFKNNWQYGEGAINTDTSREPDPNAGAAMAEITQSVLSWKMGETAYITNSLPYAYRLETGWSKQAPAGMVAVTLANFQASFARALGDAKQA